MEKVLAFSFSAGEFLDEEISEMEDKYGKDLSFFKDGECRVDKTKSHPYQWWAPQEACNEINKLIQNERNKETTIAN